MRFPKLSLFLALALTTMLAGSALAVGFSVGANAGMHGFTGDAGDGLKSGLVFGVQGDYSINPMWSAGATIGYSMSKHEDDGKLAQDLYPGGGLTGEISSDLKITQVGLNAKFFPPMTGSPIAPYLTAGVGMYMAKATWEVGSYNENSDESDFGFRGGAGANYAVNPVFAINAEADFHQIQTEGDSTNMYTIRAGVVFKLNSK